MPLSNDCTTHYESTPDPERIQCVMRKGLELQIPAWDEQVACTIENEVLADCSSEPSQLSEHSYLSPDSTRTRPTSCEVGKPSPRIKRPSPIAAWGQSSGLIETLSSMSPKIARAASELLSGRFPSNVFNSSLLNDSPAVIHRSASRRLSIGGITEPKEGTRKLLLRLTINESKDELTSLCGNGMFKGLRMNIYTDLCRVLQRSPQQVHIKDIRDAGSNRTVIEVVVEPNGWNWDVEVDSIGKRLTEQVQLNHSSACRALKFDGEHKLSSKIVHFDADDHVPSTMTNPRRHWFCMFFTAILLFASGSAAWSVGLGAPMLRSSSFVAPSTPPPRQSLGRLPLASGLRQPAQIPMMMEPVDAIYGAAILSSMISAGIQKSRGHLTLRPEIVGAVSSFRDQGRHISASTQTQTRATLGKLLLLTAKPTVASRMTRTLMRSTSTLVKKSATSVAEKRLLEEEYPAESAFLTDATNDVVESLLDWSDKASGQAGSLLLSQTHSPEWLCHKAQWLQAALDHAAPMLPVMSTCAAVAPFVPLALFVAAQLKE
eukprot:1253844-Rhodomonas_salina.1